MRQVKSTARTLKNTDGDGYRAGCVRPTEQRNQPAVEITLHCISASNGRSVKILGVHGISIADISIGLSMKRPFADCKRRKQMLNFALITN